MSKLLYALLLSTSFCFGQTLSIESGSFISINSNSSISIDELELSPSVAHTISGPNSIARSSTLYINGIRISNTAYSWTGTTLTYTSANNGNYTLSASDRVQMDYTY